MTHKRVEGIKTRTEGKEIIGRNSRSKINLFMYCISLNINRNQNKKSIQNSGHKNLIEN